MTNKIRSGQNLDYINGGSDAIAAGTVLAIEDIIGVAVTDIPPGGVGAVEIEGVFSVTAATGAWKQGEKLYWDSATSKFTNSSTGNMVAGIAAADKASAASSGLVKINVAL